MKLYYTAASVAEAVQSKPQLSLGGFKSSSPLTNAQFGNLFGDITPVTISNFNQNQYIGLILKNETGGDITNAKIWFELPDGCYVNINVAAVDLTTDGQMEHIPNISSKPLNADFVEANVDAPADLGDMVDGEEIGIWIERELLLDVIETQQAAIYAKDPMLENRFIEIILNKLDELSLCLSWD